MPDKRLAEILIVICFCLQKETDGWFFRGVDNVYKTDGILSFQLNWEDTDDSFEIVDKMDVNNLFIRFA